MDVTVADAPDRSRYEATVDGQVAGYAAYQLSGGAITFTHTKVDEQFEGHGVGSALARTALRDAHARGLHVIPLCPYIRAYMAKHPDWSRELS